MSGYAVNDWQDIELRKDTYPFCASYQISSIWETCQILKSTENKGAFKTVLMSDIPETEPKGLTSENNF